MHAARKNLLLINPWIYDFTAFDLWSKPLGLLYLASFLRQQGFNIQYIDCLDKYAENPIPKIKRYGIGNFRREIVEKPQILNHIPRNFARYGIAEETFREKLHQMNNPDAVLVTSMMTYWYLGPQHVLKIVREIFPHTPVVLGGVYATLIPEHAKQYIKPDFLVSGAGEQKTLNVLSAIFDLRVDDFNIPTDIDDYPYPAFDLINHPDYLLIMTARGCPYDCSFCAQKQIAMPFIQRSPSRVVEEIAHHYHTYQIRDFAFYDDALFINPDQHIKPILKGILNLKLPLRFHSPNGLFARFIDRELAELMFKCNFKTVRLSFETSNEERHRDMHNKISNSDMINAVNRLKEVGFKAKDLEAYILMGLPDQDLEEVLSSIIFVHNLGVQIRLASFSPIPGTREFDRAVAKKLITPNIDPLLTNKSIYPLHSSGEEFDTYRKLRIFSQLMNEAANKNFAPFIDKSIGMSLKSVLRSMH
jgi:radical SAM superfamily enzyme YgiQ (UPF0313 family)